MSPPVIRSHETIQVLNFTLHCFGCHTSIRGVTHNQPLLTLEIAEPGPVPLAGVQAAPPLYRNLLCESEEHFLAGADAAGWRKLELYTQVIAVCPDCRKFRARPEWEQRLV